MKTPAYAGPIVHDPAPAVDDRAGQVGLENRRKVPGRGAMESGIGLSRSIGTLRAADRTLSWASSRREWFLEIDISGSSPTPPGRPSRTTLAKDDPSMAHRPGRRRKAECVRPDREPRGRGLRPIPAPAAGHDPFLRLARYTWASPTTLVGLTAGLLVLGTGGRARGRRGALEFHGGGAAWVASRIGFDAMTLGHVILGRNAHCLDRAPRPRAGPRPPGRAVGTVLPAGLPGSQRAGLVARRALLSRQLVRARCAAGVR